MPFPSQVFRILIASPSDVTEEREIAVRTIQEWNDLNAAERQLVLLPLRWETHSAPEYGKRPQEIINRQVVDHCDLLVGIFWTRIGSPTGLMDSGTIEEIERVASEGKPVMLYFSQEKHDPDKLDLEQLAKLREFKKKTFPKALVENYAGVIEFKDKLSKQIEIQLRTLLAERNEIEFDDNSSSPVTDIVLQFADAESGGDIGNDLSLKTSFVNVIDFQSIPDYAAPNTEKRPMGQEKSQAINVWLSKIQDSESNRNYYRQRVTSLVLKEFFVPLRFWLKNRGAIGARDVYIDLRFNSSAGGTVLINKSKLPTTQPSIASAGLLLLSDTHPNSPDELISGVGDGWSTHMEVRALQPQRELSPAVEFLIGAKETCDVNIVAKIFADTLPEPTIQELKLKINVDNLTVGFEEILNEIILPTTKDISAKEASKQLNFMVRGAKGK
mgnify:CR=1 FL=1